MNELNSPLSKKGIVVSHLFILSLFVAVYIWLIVKHCWTLPFPSDPTLYLGPVVWKSFVGHFHALDRLMIPISIYLFSLIFSKIYIAGMIYVGFVNCLVLILGIFFCYRKGGMIAAVFVSIFLICSYYLTGFATYIYPIQTEALYCLLALICFSSQKRKWFHPVLFTGFFCAIAFFSKITAIATILFFVIYLLAEKRPRDLIPFFIGGLIGTIVAFSATILIFGYESLAYVINGLMSYFEKAMDARGPMSNMISYLQLLLSLKTLPVFLSLFILLGAYRLPKSRDAFLMALAHFVVLYCAYTFSTRGGPIIDNYGYTIFVFTSIGAAIYLGSLFENGTFKNQFLNQWEKRNSFVNVLGVLLGVILVAGMAFGLKYDPDGIFVVDWKVNYPSTVRWFYTLGPLMALGLLTFSEYSKKKSAVIILMMVTAFWSSAYCAGLGFHKAARDRSNANFFYEAVEVINEVPPQKFSIYVSRWRRVSHRLPVARVLRIYRLFFDEKYKRNFEPRHSSYEKNKKLVEESIQFLDRPEKMIRPRWPFLVTDDYRTVSKMYPNAKLLKKIDYQNSYVFIFKI